MTTKYRYIGKGTTDSNGIAHMTEDAEGQSCDGYTGTGKGLTDIIASTDDSTKISDSSIQSETYSLFDTLFCDMCPTSNPKWWNQNNAINISTDGDMKVLTTTATGNQCRPATEKTTDSTKVIYFSPSFICEFEVTEITGSWVLQTYDGSVNQNPYINSIGRYKIVYDGETVKYYKDDATSPFSQKSGFTGLTAMVGFQCWSSGQTLKYKNFKIYPI